MNFVFVWDGVDIFEMVKHFEMFDPLKELCQASDNKKNGRPSNTTPTIPRKLLVPQHEK